jgi:hypothetical protein
MGRQAYCNGASNHDLWRMETGFVMTLPAAMSTIPAELRLIQSLASVKPISLISCAFRLKKAFLG